MESWDKDLADKLADALAAAQAAMETRDSPEAIAEAARKAAEREREREAAELRAWRKRYDQAAPVRAAALAWSARETPATIAVQKWLGDTSKHLVLRGGVGSGKTTAACVAVKHWTGPQGSARHGVTWLRPDQVVSAVLHDYDENSPKLRRYVVIDDMGLETKGDFAAALCELLDRPEHTLLITTNLTKQAMRERYDLRVLDRLNDSATPVDLPGKSMRRQDGGF